MSRTSTLTMLALVVGPAYLNADSAPPGPTTLVQRQGNASATVFAGNSANGVLQVRLSGVVDITLSVEGKPPLEVEPARPVTDSAAWHVKETLAAATAPLTGGRERWQQSYVLVPLDKGDQPLPLLPLRYREQQGEWQSVSWQPIPVTVTTTIRRVDLSEARDITDIERLPPVRPWWEWALWALLGLVCASLVVWAWRLARRLRRGQAALSPAQLALHELDRLAGLKLPEAGRVERFHTLVSNILRHYLEKRFQIPAQRQTTAEFLGALGQAPELSASQQALVRDFLERCDLAKFAAFTPELKACDAVADMARTLVEQTAVQASPPTTNGETR
jgi:hypothetical protein